MAFDRKLLENYPVEPGVYLMKSAEGAILYVGKAKNLKQRLKQYFFPNRDGRVMVPYLTAHVEAVDTIVVTSEKEALILENNLIKKYQPKYNALLKDDKTFCSLKINNKHPWPMVRIVRYKGKPPNDGLYFGPYTQAYAARQTLELLRTLFPLRQCSDHELASRSRPCILYDLKKCVAPCVLKCTKEEYDNHVERVIKFLKGHDDEILKELYHDMEVASSNLQFERAQQLHRTITYIESTLETQRVQKAGQRDLDALALYRQADEIVVSQIIYREGKLLNVQDYSFFNVAQDDEEIISSFILQHYGEKEEIPPEIIVPIELSEQDILGELLSLNRRRKTEISYVTRGDKKALVELAQKNAEAKFKRDRDAKSFKEKTLLEMEETLRLTNFPKRIECFDQSHISGSEPVSAMVVFQNGEKETKSYRKYKIKTAKVSDDYGGLAEVLQRRYAHAKDEGILPDLIIIDGGKGHLSVAMKILSDLDISTVDVISLAKEESRHDKGMTLERVFTLSQQEPIQLKAHSPLLFLLQQIRDEAHRFAITFQRLRQSKKSLKSKLDSIPGMGPVKRKRLLEKFGSLKRILEASNEELKEVKGINQSDIQEINKLKDEVF